MTILLDTHLLLWAATGDSRLSDRAIALIEEPSNILQFSVASIWEIVTKNSLGRKDFQVNASIIRGKLIENDYKELAITGKHVLAVATLPHLHKDPFDRIIIAQAASEGVILLTGDRLVASYSSTIMLV